MRRGLLVFCLAFIALDAFAGKGRIIIRSLDSKGVGFADSTPVQPVGGNSGTTLGEQRLNVFREAARRWENTIDTDVDIIVAATFAPIEDGCDDSSAILGQAGPREWVHSGMGFPNAPLQNVWYPIGLANKISGTDLRPEADDIFARFNADVDKESCLSASNSDWYYGFDGNHGDDVDLFVVVLHELAHGLGIAGKGGSAEFSENRPAIFNTRMLDLTAGMRWDQMSAEQRRVSITNTGNLVWEGQNVREQAPRWVTPTPIFTVTEPAAIARNFDIGTASFGPAVRTSTLSGRVVVAKDGTDATSSSTTDGCTALTNASEIAGNIALIDRNNCTFVVKALNAQAAGAAGVIIANMPATGRDETCYPPGMGGSSRDVQIPVISVSTTDGNTLKAQLNAAARVSGLLHTDPTQLAGASREGYMRLYAPCAEEPGSSTYHWDVVASPNLLMEPNVNADLLHGVDLTVYQLMDIGWTQPPRTGRRILKR